MAGCRHSKLSANGVNPRSSERKSARPIFVTRDVRPNGKRGKVSRSLRYGCGTLISVSRWTARRSRTLLSVTLRQFGTGLKDLGFRHGLGDRTQRNYLKTDRRLEAISTRRRRRISSASAVSPMGVCLISGTAGTGSRRPVQDRQAGAAALRQNAKRFTQRRNGPSALRRSGKEITRSVADADGTIGARSAVRCGFTFIILIAFLSRSAERF
jgi:hypothetical protein